MAKQEKQPETFWVEAAQISSSRVRMTPGKKMLARIRPALEEVDRRLRALIPVEGKQTTSHRSSNTNTARVGFLTTRESILRLADCLQTHFGCRGEPSGRDVFIANLSLEQNLAVQELRLAVDALVDWFNRQRQSIGRGPVPALPRELWKRWQGVTRALHDKGGDDEKPQPKPLTDSPHDPRDKWLYEECRKGTAYTTILIRLKRKPKSWERLESVQGIRGAVKRYCKRHNLPEPPKRQKGRKARS